MNDFSSLGYAKADATIEVPEPKAREVKTVAAEIPVAIVSPAGYVKGDEFKEPQRLIVIYSGGTKREKDYFRLITRNPELFPLLKLKFYVDENLGPGHRPLVFDLALTQTRSYKSSADKERPDSYYVVTDVDLFMQHIIDYKPRFEAEDISLVVSNPCLEVWLYYSKRDDKFAGFVEPDDKDKLSECVKTYVHTATGGVNTVKAIYDLDANIANAIKNYTEDANGIPEKYSTSMYRLGQQIAPLVKQGLEELRVKRLELIENRR